MADLAGFKVVSTLVLLALTVLLTLFAASVSAQDVTPEQGADSCLVSVSVEEQELKLGETMHLWIWGVGVAPDGWDLKVDGTGSVALRSAREIETEGNLVEWTVVGEREGQVTFTAGMACEKPGNGTDTLTLTVLPAEPETATSSATEEIADFCSTRLSVRESVVAVGGEFSAWFVGAGTEPRTWHLDMSGDGSANVAETRELDPEYVEWQLKAMEAGTVRFAGSMNCIQPGDGVSIGEVLIVERENRIEPTTVSWLNRGFQIGAWGRVSIVEVGLIAVLLAVLAVLVYLLVRRR
ncbi:MAG: hypothetical protein F4W95_00755 [Chloroflexi bacterium]|nr:hypothetical protein [Chloroflexota bacterium]MYD46997.1 hypothetical protein [Chloroflexota bacterium]